MVVSNCCTQNLCICDDGFNTCDKCEEVFPVKDMIWESDQKWWANRKLSHAEQNLYRTLCEECFKEFE